MAQMTRKERHWMVEREVEKIMKDHPSDPYYEAQCRAQIALHNGNRKTCDLYRSVATRISRRMPPQIIE